MKSVAYSPLDGLVDLACRDGVDVRPTLLRVLTDLYVQRPAHSAEEETQYVELALGLIDTVDAPTRAAVAATLAAYPGAPAAVIDRLGQAHAAPPERPLPHPERAAFLEQDLAALFFSATAEERRLILTNLDLAAGPASRSNGPAPGETLRQLEAAVFQHNPGEVSRLLSRALGIDLATAARIVRDQSGEPIVVAARALGMKAAMLQRILLFLNPSIGQSVARVYDLARLFDELTPSAAQRMVAIWQHAGSRPKTRHAPQYWDDETRGARAAATPARRPNTRSGEQTPFKARSGRP